MKRIRMFFTFVLLVFAFPVFAQTVEVTGKIVDAKTGEGVPFASILVKNSTVGTAADADGVYSIEVAPDAVLIFISVGYADTEVPVAGKTKINVSLNPDAEFLDETIVVAYGVQKKSSFVGSAVQVSGEKLERMQSTNISKSLEGAVTGLQTSSSSGTPGSSASIIIRGFGSVSASQTPLIVVDGVPYEGSLNSIPTHDIESMTVLKDAAANSMYGARGSNGVIIITTKRGAEGKVSISFDAKVGVNTRGVPAYDVITDPADYYEMAWESARNLSYYKLGQPLGQANAYASGALIDGLLHYNIFKGIRNDEVIDPETGKINPNATDLKWNDNWQKDVFRPGLRQEYTLSASGGSKNTQGYFSASYLNDQGYVPNSGFSRISVRGKVDQTIGKFIRAGVNISYSNTVMNQFGSEGTSQMSNLFYFTQNIAPIYPIYKYDLETGERLYGDSGEDLYDWGETRPGFSNNNPYGQLLTSKLETVTDNISSRGYLDIQILKDLKFQANVAFDVFNQKSNTFTSPLGGDALAVNGRGTQEYVRVAALNANQLLSYTPVFGDHSVSLLLGHETKSDTNYGMSGQMTNFLDPSNTDFANAVVYNGLTSSTDGYFLQGIFGRAEYSYANKYYGSVSYRRDASSRFHPDVRWGSFWAVGASWNMKQENFLLGVSEVDMLKLKASYGTQGNDNLNVVKVYEDLYTVERVDGEASIKKVFRAAPDVTWEKSDNFNAGFESRFFNRLSLNAEFFIKETKDMIYYLPLAPSQGSPSSQLVNDMDMMNTGVEFELSADLIKTSDFVWNLTLNGTHYKNKITKLPSDKPAEGYQNGDYWRKLGGSLYDWYMFEWAGVDPDTGLPCYYRDSQVAKTNAEGIPLRDAQGNIIYETVTEIVHDQNLATRRELGKTPIPALYGGITTSFYFHGFDISAAFAYQIGGWTLDSNYQSLMGGGSYGQNWHKDIFQRWTPQNVKTNVPLVMNGDMQASATSTRFLTDASYLSLRNVTIGYTLPKKVTDRISMEGIRVYLTGDNLFYLSRRRGMDVRQSFSGAVGATYSALRTVSAGVSIAF